jgi:hypothetical protein
MDTSKFTKKFFLNLGLFALAAGAAAAAGVLAGADISVAVVTTAGLTFIRAAAGVIAAALGGPTFPGQGDEPA